MKAIRIARIPALLLAFGVLLAGCSSPSAVSILAPTIQGPPGHQFALSFLKVPSGPTAQGNGVDAPHLASTRNGPGIELFSYWGSRNVDALVYELADAVPRTRVNPVLRSFLPMSRGARMTTWRGFPAATDSVPCSTQAVSCRGVVNVLVVLKDSTIYEVMVNAPTNFVSAAVFNSFRLISQRQLESSACKLINAPPNPPSGTWEAISVKVSTLSALEKTDSVALQSAVRAYDAAAKAQNTSAMIRALADGVRTCHRLGLKTGT
jgi:hypothetical protein